jgi:hypothetical protein
MRIPRMTIRGLAIAIAVEGLVLSVCISLPWLVVVPVVTAIVFVPQLTVIGICSYLATREWSVRRQSWSTRGQPAAETASPEIWYIETETGTVDPCGIVFMSAFEPIAKSPG